VRRPVQTTRVDAACVQTRGRTKSGFPFSRLPCRGPVRSRSIRFHFQFSSSSFPRVPRLARSLLMHQRLVPARDANNRISRLLTARVRASASNEYACSSDTRARYPPRIPCRLSSASTLHPRDCFLSFYIFYFSPSSFFPSFFVRCFVFFLVLFLACTKRTLHVLPYDRNFQQHCLVRKNVAMLRYANLSSLSHLPKTFHLHYQTAS